MHVRFVVLLLLAVLLGGCHTEPAPVDAATQAERQDPKGNPLKGTALDAQGEALKKAKAVEDTLNQAAERRMDEADAASQ